MEPAFTNCIIDEFNNSDHHVLASNANTQIDFIAEQSKEFFDDHQQQQNNQHHIQQFNDGLNNFIQETTTITTTTTSTDVNNPFGIENNFGQCEKMNEINGDRQFQEQFIHDFTTSNGKSELIGNDTIDNEFTKDDLPSDCGAELCPDVTDDIGMMTTENSEHSTLSHSKDTLPLSDNFNPFDNKAETMSEFNSNDNEFDRDHHIRNLDINDEEKSTPMISPDSEEIMNQGSDGMNDLISPDEENHEPIVEDIAPVIDMVKLDTSSNFADDQYDPDFEQKRVEIDEENHHEEFQIHEKDHTQDIDETISIEDKYQREEHEELEEHDDLEEHEEHQQPEMMEKDLSDHEEVEHKQVMDLQIKVTIQNDIEQNLDYNEDMVQQHNETYGLNSIKENEFESNDIADENEQNSEMTEMVQNPLVEKINEPSANQEFSNEQFGAITEDVQTEEAQRSDMVLEEKFNEHFSSEKNFDADYIPDGVQQQHEHPEQELQNNVEHETDDDDHLSSELNIVNGHHLPEEVDNPEEHHVHDQEFTKAHEESLDNESHSPELLEQQPIIEQQHIEEHVDIEATHMEQQFELDEQPPQQIMQQHLDDDGFVEQEFTEHDNFEAEIEQNVTAINDVQLNADRQVDDESEDEWKYMQLKEGQGEKIVPIDNNHTNDLQNPEIIDEVMQIEEDQSKSPNIVQHLNEEILEQVEESLSIITTKISQEANLFDSAEEREQVNEIVNQESSGIQVSSPQPINPNLSCGDGIDNEDDDMNYQLNPEAKEFIPLSPPISAGKFFIDNAVQQLSNGGGITQKFIQPHLSGDDVVAQSPRKGAVINMDEIYVPDETEFDVEASHRPHEILESADDDNNAATVLADDLYQELNLKEAMHGSEKEEQILSPSGLLQNHELITATNISNNHAEYNPVAEFENIDMKDSIYIQKSTISDEVEPFEMPNVQEMLNQVQLIPDTEEYGNNSFEFISKEESMAGQNEKDIASPIAEVLDMIGSGNADIQYEQDQQQIETITNGMDILNLSKDDAIQNDHSEIENGGNVAAAVGVGAVTVGAVVAAVVAVTSEDANTKKKVAEKNLKNKIDTAAKLPKVPEKNKMPINKSSAIAPKKIPSTTSSTASSKVSTSSTKPKTLTVTSTSSATAPKTLTFPRPRTAPAPSNISSGGTAGKTLTDRKLTNNTTTGLKSKIDTTRPATLTIKKTVSKATTTESKTNTVKPAVSKTGVTAKASTTSRVSMTSNGALNKARPSSTTSTTSTTNSTGTKSNSLLRPTQSVSKTITSPRGTLSSTLRKTEAIKIPSKTTTGRVVNSSSTTSTVSAPKTTTVKTTTTKTTTATRTSGSTTSRTAPIRKTTTSSSSLAPGKPSAASIAANQRKPSPIKRPVPPPVAEPSVVISDSINCPVVDNKSEQINIQSD